MSNINESSTQNQEWNPLSRITLYFFSAYFLLHIIPFDYKFYGDFFHRFSGLTYETLFQIAHYTPQFTGTKPHFLDWLVIAILAGIITAMWLAIEKKKGIKVQHDHLLYVVRSVVRYRLAIAVFAYGFIKFFPLQSPYPSISNLNTAYGDLTDWKMFSQSLGIVPGYQSFLGGVEIFAGLALLWRKTASIGAFFVIVFTGNVFFSNLAYTGGEYVYSFYLITLAIFVFWYDLKRLADLTTFEVKAFPNQYKPTFIKGSLKVSVYLFKGLVLFLFFGLYSFQIASDFNAKNIYHYPTTPGLKDAAGIYQVASFVINNDTLPHSKTDTVRWNDVVFETWNTISIRVNKNIVVDTANVESVTLAEKDRNYEAEGTAGRLYYSYTTDTVNNKLILINKNKHYKDDSLFLNYERTADRSIILKGKNSYNDSLYVLLKYIDKKYLLKEAFKTGRRKGLKI